MSRIVFTSTIEEIVGRLAGSVFQDSYMGLQVRTRVTPRNPRTYYQQLRRGEFGFITQLWRELTPAQRSTWSPITGKTSSAFHSFCYCNINLSLINLPPVASFAGGYTPFAFSFTIAAMEHDHIEIITSRRLPQVPAGQSCIFFATPEKVTPKQFTNPSMFSPIAILPENTYTRAGYDLTAAWISRYGQMTTGKQICLKSALVNNTSGLRGLEPIKCATEPEEPNLILESAGNYLVDSDGTIITYP